MMGVSHTRVFSPHFHLVLKYFHFIFFRLHSKYHNIFLAEFRLKHTKQHDLVQIRNKQENKDIGFSKT